MAGATQIRNPPVRRLNDAGRVIKGAPRYLRAKLDGREREKPWLVRPQGWSASLLEWIVWWYFTVHGVEPGGRKLRPGLDFYYQMALGAPGLFAKQPFAREDFILPNAAGGAFRGVVFDPYTTFTHKDPLADRRKRTALNGVGFKLIFLEGGALEANPQYVIELGRRGIDLSPRGTVGGWR